MTVDRCYCVWGYRLSTTTIYQERPRIAANFLSSLLLLCLETPTLPPCRVNNPSTRRSNRVSYLGIPYGIISQTNSPVCTRAAISVHKLQKYTPTTSAEDWRYRAGGRRAQVSFRDIPRFLGLFAIRQFQTHSSGPSAASLATYTLIHTVSWYRLVIETLDPLPQDRKCFRMVNGVLVERTVKDVLPTLKTNSDGLKQVLEEMLKQYKSKQTELDTWKVSVILNFSSMACPSRQFCVTHLLKQCQPITNLFLSTFFRRETIFKLCSLDKKIYTYLRLDP